ncbi:MAG: aminotransferase class IV [Acidobacteria bacterium]|nr:aminotransferase class IV [Acidobacteriota bacterium]
MLKDKHWRRLLSNAELLGINVSAYSEESVFTALAELANANSLHTGVGRITFFDVNRGGLWTGNDKDLKPTLLITTRENRNTPAEFSLAISPFLVNSTSPLAGIKSGNYLENLMAFQEAKERGFHEAVRVNERGFIVSGCMCNIFWRSKGQLFTPKLSTGCLPGTTRELILETFECKEVAASVSDLETAEEIFLTSAGIGIVQIRNFNGVKLSIGNDHLTSLLET